MANAIELRSVTKRFGQHTAVNELDLVVPEGSIYGFYGAGLRLLEGLRLRVRVNRFAPRGFGS